MGGFAFCASYDEGAPKSLFEISTNLRSAVEVPKSETFLYIMEHFPDIITDITEEYILDRAASSSLSKALLIVQVAWFCINCASRLFQRLPLSLLEVSTAAHAFCTLITYLVWLSKPHNVSTPTLLREKEAREVYALLKCSDDEYDEALRIAENRAAGDSSSEKIVLAAGALQHRLVARPPHLRFRDRDRMLVPGSYGSKSLNTKILFIITMVVSPILYGMIHLLAWNYQFPTPLERTFWRVSSLVVTCSGLVEVFLGLPSEWLKYRNKTPGLVLKTLISFVLLFVVPLAHMLASGFLVVDSFRQLLFLGDAAYLLPTWSQYWPHLS